MTQAGGLFNSDQLAVLQAAFHQGSLEASRALENWLGKPALIESDALVLLPLEEATEILGDSDRPVMFGAVQITGALSGEMILVFDEESGHSLVETLVGGSSANGQWDELTTSAVLETTNIVCCAYLNSLASRLHSGMQSVSLLPTAPVFQQEYPQSLLQFALMGQAVASDFALIAKTRFEVDATPVNWTLLLIPDSSSIMKLPRLLDTRADSA